MSFRSKRPNTSWNKVGNWYNKLLNDETSYYHEHIVLPKTLALLDLKQNSTLLDVGCGQGILAKRIPPDIDYYGIDNSSKLIEFAKKQDRNPRHHFKLVDATKPFNLPFSEFSHAVFILSLQNMEFPEKALLHVSSHLKENGTLVLVLNHPCFRIPRQSSWGIDEQNKLQYRRINRYMSSLKIPITMHPGQETSPLTWSFHVPLSTYTEYLYQTGFMIEKIEEWISDKISVGKASKMENRGRSEFPLFLAFRCRNLTKI